MLKFIPITLTLMLLVGCGKPSSYSVCMLEQLDGKPDSAKEYASDYCKGWFPREKVIYDVDVDKVSWSHSYEDKIKINVSRGASDASYVTRVRVKFSTDSCDYAHMPIRPWSREEDFLIPYGQTSASLTLQSRGDKVKGGKDMKCMRTFEVFGKRKPPTWSGRFSSQFLGEDYISL